MACVIDDLGTGGAQTLVSLKARALVGHGVRPVVIGLGTRDQERARLLEDGIEVHVLPAASSLASPMRLLRLVRLLRRLEPDLVHTHLLASHILGGIAGRLLRVPVVSTLHNIDPHPRFAGTWKREAETLCLRFAASRLIAVGPSVAASNALRLGKRRIDVLANPLSTSPGERAPAGAAEDDGVHDPQRSRSACRAQVARLTGSTEASTHILTVGRLATEKGWPGFLDVIERLRRTHSDIRLISVGDGPCAEMLEREIARRDLGEHVYLAGRRDDVRTFYLGSDVFVLNSTIEGLPMALLEAMAAGLPVVSTRVGDVEYAASEDVARLVEPGQTDEMVEALRQTLDRSTETERRAREGRARVLERFELECWTRDLLEIYRGIAPLPDGEGEALHADRSATPSSGGYGRAGAASGRRPLHIVEIVDGLGAGGAQALIALRARNAHRMGYRIDVVSLWTGDAVLPLLTEHVDGVHLFPSPKVFDRGRIVRLCALLRRLKPDVVHTHLRTSNIVGALCGRLTNVPVVATLHNVFPELGLEHARRDWAEKWALRLGASRIVAVGPGVALTHRPRLGDTPVAAIPNPVELPSDGLDPTERRARARASLDLPFDPTNARIVLVVARLTRVKGAPEAVQVMQRLVRASSSDTPPLKLLIAGEGALREELQQLVESGGLAESVFLLGRTKRVRELMAASDVMLLGSHIEGLPLVLLEAMSMHLPIVATRVGDVPWLLGEGEFGELVEPGDVEGLTAAVQRTLDLPDEPRRALVDRAFQRVADTFSVEGWLLDIDRVLRDSSRTGRRIAPPRAATSGPNDPPAPLAEDRARASGLDQEAAIALRRPETTKAPAESS